VLEAARLFLSSHIREIPWAGGVLGKMSGSCLRHHYTGNGSFFTTFITITGKQTGSWSESIFSLGELIAAPQCANRTGESGLFFCFLSHFFRFSRNLLQSSPLGDTACGSVLFGSSFRCSDERASPLCYWIFSPSENKRQMFDY
jgi:hypothetical protein